MSTVARFSWFVCLIVAGTVGAVFLPLGLCLACDVSAGILVVIGPERPPCP